MRPGLLYQAGVAAYREAIRVAALWNPKAKRAIAGRNNWTHQLHQKAAALGAGKRVWIHCASLGEFEQGRPVIEAIREAHPSVKIILTFFSPSGYEVRKGYNQANIVCYLPFDSSRSAQTFMDLLKPDLAIFIKYELWLNYLFELRQRKVPHFLVSALIRASSPYFTSILKEAYREAFSGFTRILVQDTATGTHLSQFTGRTDIVVAGDTRYDRVAALASSAAEVPHIREFIANRRCIVAGSTWPEDEAYIFSNLNKYPAEQLCWIIAPHEIHGERITRIMSAFPKMMARYSKPEEITSDKSVLWIDNIGMLNRLYRYGMLACIGGGFGKGIHNTLEAVAYGTPVVFGPNYQRFDEAVELLQSGFARIFRTQEELENIVSSLLNGQSLFNPGVELFVPTHCGATQKVMAEISPLLR